MYATILNKIAEYQQSIEQLKTYLENTAIQQLTTNGDPQLGGGKYTFGFAIASMKLGYTVTRKSWKGNKFLIPPLSNLDIVNKIPNRVMGLIDRSEIICATYRYTYFTISLQGICANNTNLSWEDLTATDWEIAY